MLSWWQRLTGNTPSRHADAFFDRFTGRTLIIHDGLPVWWSGELAALAGGGAHLRLDIRRIGHKRLTPVEWITRQHILSANPPLPALVRVEQQRILRIRHLRQGEHLVQPSDLWWILQELDRRWHFCIHLQDDHRLHTGIALHDNELDYGNILTVSDLPD